MRTLNNFREIYESFMVMESIKYPQNGIRATVEKIYRKAEEVIPQISQFERYYFCNDSLWEEINVLKEKPRFEKAAHLLEEIQKCQVLVEEY